MSHTDKNGDLNSDSIELPGFKVDRYGTKFAVPVDDDDSIFGSNALDWPNRERLANEGWYCYFEKEEDLGTCFVRGFRPVSREEAGFVGVEGTTEYGTPDELKQPHRVGNMVLVKAPMEVYTKIDKARQKVARAATHPILFGAKNKKIDHPTEQGNVTTEDTLNPSFTVSRTTEASGQK